MNCAAYQRLNSGRLKYVLYIIHVTPHVFWISMRMFSFRKWTWTQYYGRIYSIYEHYIFLYNTRPSETLRRNVSLSLKWCHATMSGGYASSLLWNMVVFQQSDIRPVAQQKYLKGGIHRKLPKRTHLSHTSDSVCAARILTTVTTTTFNIQ